MLFPRAEDTSISLSLCCFKVPMGSVYRRIIYLVVGSGTVLQKQGKHKTCRAGRSLTIATLDLRRRLELGRMVVP